MEAFLKDFHKKKPSCTPMAFFHGFSSQGLCSYDYLVSLLTEKDKNASITDLACGDGTLSRKIIEHLGSGIKLVGVDMSAGELEVARKNLDTNSVELIEANAQDLPLSNDYADFILCHMAFMLMENVEKVVSEIHRCLKPQGVFSAVVGGKFERSPIYDIFLGLLGQALKEENKNWLSDLGDRRTRSGEGLVSLFEETRFSEVNVQEFKLIFHEKPVDLMNFFMMMYDVGLLSEERQKQLYTDLLQSLNSIRNEDGRIEHFMWVRQITCRKR